MLVSLLLDLIKIDNIKINKIILVGLVVLVVLVVLIVELKICQIYWRLEKSKTWLIFKVCFGKNQTLDFVKANSLKIFFFTFKAKKIFIYL